MQYLFNPRYIDQLYIKGKKAIEGNNVSTNRLFKVCGSQFCMNSFLFLSAKHFTKKFFKYLKSKKLF